MGRVTTNIAFAAAGVLLTLSSSACTSASSDPTTTVVTFPEGLPGDDEDAGPRIDDPTVCWAAGGQCVSVDVFGNPECALLGPDNACYPSQNGGGSFCCAYEAGVCPWRTVMASDYNQACDADSDCVPVAEGDPCTLCGLRCVNAAINIEDLAYYSDAISRSAAYLSSQRPACDLDCPPASEDFGSCCIAGTCQFGSQCGIPGTSRDAAALDASASDVADASAE